jgi:hypothetical protein
VSVLTTRQYRDATTYPTETGHSYVFISASIAAVLMLAAVALIAANIAGRYLFFHPLASAQEIMLFLLVGTVFSRPQGPAAAHGRRHPGPGAWTAPRLARPKPASPRSPSA